MATYYELINKLNGLSDNEEITRVTDDTIKNFLTNIDQNIFIHEYHEVKPEEDTHSLNIEADNKSDMPFVAMVWTEDTITEGNTMICEIIINFNALLGKNLGTGGSTVLGKVLLIYGNATTTTLAHGSTLLTDEGTSTSSIKYYYDEGVFKASQSTNFFRSALTYKCLFLFMKG